MLRKIKHHKWWQILNRKTTYEGKDQFSKKWLEKILGKSISTICYPIGGVDKDIIECAKASGFQYGITTLKCSLQLPNDRFTLRRVDIKNHIVGDKFKKAVGPFYGFRRFLTRPFRAKYRVDFRHPSFK